MKIFQQTGVSVTDPATGRTFRRLDLLAQGLAIGQKRLLFRRVFFRGDELGNLVLALLDSLGLVNDRPAAVIELHHMIRTGLDLPVDAIGGDGVQIVADEGGVEHGLIRPWKNLLL